ncbi:Os06g0652800 [Oryza sativa Japonica Group]|uniref:Os06g0652800 protein n=1 Tax=Oryza sativa subsp. japonica TaxID=39947 RepID=A0A0P0WZW6_ORYSJ|nr:Os06g0652800 [Oryza sativa Japonica Group]
MRRAIHRHRFLEEVPNQSAVAESIQTAEKASTAMVESRATVEWLPGGGFVPPATRAAEWEWCRRSRRSRRRRCGQGGVATRRRRSGVATMEMELVSHPP